MSGSVLFYVQHLLGIGHLRRALFLVDAMACAGLAVTLAAGGEPLPDLARSKALRVVQLPWIRASDAAFKNLVGADGRPPDEALWSARREALHAALAEVDPDALVIEAYPFGRRAFRRELDPMIAAAKARHPRPVILGSLRDIVVAPAEARRQQEIVDRVRADFDAVLVHGDRRLIALEASFPLASKISNRIVYTGYVTAPKVIDDKSNDGAGEVLVSAGGGAVGGRLLRTALEARRGGCLADAPWRVLTGPNLPDAEFTALRAELPDGVIVERYRSDFPQMLRRCCVSVSQAGYNTVLDIVAARVAAVLVPFAEMRETEQTLRAERLAQIGVVEMLSPATLEPDRLADAIGRAIRNRPVTLELDLDGARRTAMIIADMLRNRGYANTFRQIQGRGG